MKASFFEAIAMAFVLVISCPAVVQAAVSIPYPLQLSDRTSHTALFVCCEEHPNAVRPPLVNAKEGRNWGPEQATGAPDTEGTSSIRTAWASHTADGRDEWLLLSYAEPVAPVAVLIYEQCQPGAVCRVTAVDSAGNETELWSGDDPTSTDAEKGISVIVPQDALATRRIAVYLKSSEVAGWNEIDAVGLLDATGTVHWATVAHASSTYADASETYDTIAEVPGPIVDAHALQALEQRVSELEEELLRLRGEME